MVKSITYLLQAIDDLAARSMTNRDDVVVEGGVRLITRTSVILSVHSEHIYTTHYNLESSCLRRTM